MMLGVAKAVLLLMAVLKASAQDPITPSAPESGFADELDQKYGSGGEDILEAPVMRQLIQFQDDEAFTLPKSGQTLELGKDEPTLGLGSPLTGSDLGEELKNPQDTKSHGVFMKAVGSFTIADWIVTVEDTSDALASVKRKALEASSADPVALIELGEAKDDDLEVETATALASQDGNHAAAQMLELGSSDEQDEDESEKVQPRRPGWGQPIPGISLKVATADMLLAASKKNADETEKQREEVAPEDPGDAPVAAPTVMKLVGCYEDGHKAKALPVAAGDGLVDGDKTKPNSMNPVKCAALCRSYNKGYKLMGLQTMGSQSFCYCGRSTGKAQLASADKCRLPCAGAPELKCGAEVYMSVFAVDVAATGESCWSGKEVMRGLDPDRPWERYRGCAICDGTKSTASNLENWQRWGDPLGFYSFAGCLSCDPQDALVVTDPKKGAGFCASYHPEVDKVMSHVYPYYAHWDAASHFTHTKFVQKLASPNMRSGKALALCRLWKQVSCAPNEKALRQVWDQYRANSVTMGARQPPQLRYLECRTVKTIKCNKVCLKTEPALGKVRCGPGGKHVHALPKDGLKYELGKGDRDQAGHWCCYNECQVPRTHSSYREDGSFWCKDAAMML